ncbi:hypothetical protein ACFE04_010972 [Oxalis oulophora]
MASSNESTLLPLHDGSKSPATTAMTRKGAYAAISYMVTGVLLILFNKAALSSYRFPSGNVITLFQTISSCAFLYALKRFKMISFTNEEPENATTPTNNFVPLKTLVHTFPLSFTFLLYMLITMEAVRSISVPMYTTLRRTTVAFTLIVEYFLSGQRHSLAVVSSVGVVILGAFIAGAWDLAFDAYGYSVVCIANLCTAVYLASIARIGKASGLNTFGLMWCNGIICGPLLLIWTSISGELTALVEFPYLFAPGFQVVMLVSCIMAFLINYFVFLNTTENSALTQAVCGNLKDFFTVGIGWAVFGGLPFDLDFSDPVCMPTVNYKGNRRDEARS